MSSSSKGDKNVSNNESGGSTTPRERGGKLARRARSFKEDFLDILSQMRSPGSGGGGGSAVGSPKPPRSPKHRTSSTSDSTAYLDDRNPLHDLDHHVKQVQRALKHFRDVVSRNKLEVLPGNGTVVLENIATIHSLLKTYVFIDQSSSLVSATNQVYQSLARLIKLCDEVLVGGEKALNQQNVTEVLVHVEEAVQNLVRLASAKISEVEGCGKGITTMGGSERRCTQMGSEVARSSLPDIPLTPRERQILEATSGGPVPDTPPPKPPLPPTRVWVGDSPPPLPPKKKGGPPSASMEGLSLRSDTSSLGSLDSVLNTSSGREDEDAPLAALTNGSQTSCWDSNSEAHSPEPSAGIHVSATSSTATSFVSVRTSYSSSTTSTRTTSSSTTIQEDMSSTTNHQEVPPQLPVKKRSIRERTPSQYDNVDCSTDPAKPPPLPLKKKHIMAYMEMFGNCSHPPSSSELLRHSMHSYALQAEWQHQQQQLTHQTSITTTSHSSHFSMMSSSSSTITTSYSGTPPALPPKQRRPLALVGQAIGKRPAPSPPPTPPPASSGVGSSISSGTLESTTPTQPEPVPLEPSSSLPLSAASAVAESPTSTMVVVNGGGGSSTLAASPISVLEPSPPSAVVGPLFELDVCHLLVFKKPDEEGPEIRGGHPDALLVQATKANKNKHDFLYQEAFLTTYRTFISPCELIEKLCLRHQRLSSCSGDHMKLRAAREAFSLLVRVVSDLTMIDLEDGVVQSLMDFVYQLLCRGELTMAKALRVKILEKYNAKQLNTALLGNTLLSSHNVYTRQSTLLDFKSEQVAEQMTLLDSELFMKIEIPEVLIWAQEQNEERSPNLTRFTEHFNKMSYWARSRILEQTEAKDREKYVVKFIKIMKHLRKINNFNSYLALLSALDSAPIRRLEWQKHITEGLKEYCALIDSSSSFRAYRQALADTHPPCIPYIGLVLQDLTFVHIGNSDYLSDGVINFSKRWQQFNIVENMKRFKKGTYSFKKNERIIASFSNFDNFLCEEAMWQISENIKPRGAKKPT